ncbi:MAG: dynamin [Cyanothece sp. SIO1E1]|nr:dynamin [Cyanothece sp. SIO1E1]
MEQSELCQNLLTHLRAAISLLDCEQDEQLRQDIISVCDHFANPSFRMAVLGPFGHGKSTLLNAMLGRRTLLIDLIPTTGAAIRVKYGPKLHTQITLVDGTQIAKDGTEILKNYAILDGQRQMRGDVASVQVCCPHPFLQTGVELLDLPETNDQAAQDQLIRDQLLAADLVIQVLDARKLMTLEERENLRDWLLNRGITTVIFVVNFLNLLDATEQKDVLHRLRFVAESFRAELPPGISNLHRVDALPALRTRLKGDTAAAQTTGLAGFESALQAVVTAQQEKVEVNRLPRLRAIAIQVQQALHTQITAIATEVKAVAQKHQQRVEIQQQAEQLIKQGFNQSLSEFQQWLSTPQLLKHYQTEMVAALQQGEFHTWEKSHFRKAVLAHQQDLLTWVDKGCSFFGQEHPGAIAIAFPSLPSVAPPKTSATNVSEPGRKDSKGRDVAPIAVATGIGWALGGPVGAAVAGAATYILSGTKGQEKNQPEAVTQNQVVQQICTDIAKTYLTRFSIETSLTLNQYALKAEQAISAKVMDKAVKITSQHHQLQLLKTLLENLSQDLDQG